MEIAIYCATIFHPCYQKNLIINFFIESCAEIPCKLSYLFFYSASNKQKNSKEMKKLYLKMENYAKSTRKLHRQRKRLEMMENNPFFFALRRGSSKRSGKGKLLWA